MCNTQSTSGILRTGTSTAIYGNIGGILGRVKGSLGILIVLLDDDRHAEDLTMAKKRRQSTSPHRRTLMFPPNRLQQLMTEQSWTPHALAVKLQVDIKSVRKWLDGTTQPYRTKLDVFLKAFGCATEAALYGHEQCVSASVEQTCDPRHNRDGNTSFVIPPNLNLDERTYYRYRTLSVPQLASQELVTYLESRHGCKAFRLGGKAFPASVLWQNTTELINPDSVLGPLDMTVHRPLQESPHLKPALYEQARLYIKQLYESPPSPITAEGLNYRMIGIDLNGPIPRIRGAFGRYYDNILTQYAMEWELKKAIVNGGIEAVNRLDTVGTLPIREAVESHGNPVIDGTGRCAAITISTLLVFNRRRDGYFCLVRRRSAHVGVSPGMVHVVPAGMFEAKNSLDPWSVTWNVWRELLEEVYEEEEQQQTGIAEFPDYMLRKRPIPLLEKMLDDGSAEFSITGLCCDLLNLRPEICTVLFVRDHRFCEERRMRLNWEYLREGPDGKFAVPWAQIDQVISSAEAGHVMVASGAVCLGLGQAWIRSRFHM